MDSDYSEQSTSNAYKDLVGFRQHDHSPVSGFNPDRRHLNITIIRP